MDEGVEQQQQQQQPARFEFTYSLPDPTCTSTSPDEQQDEQVFSEWHRFHGYLWRLLVFPKGNHTDHPSLSIYLECGGPSHGVTVNRDQALPSMAYAWAIFAKFNMSLLHPCDGDDVKTMTRYTQHTFTPNVHNWGFLELVPFADIISDEYASEGEDNVKRLVIRTRMMIPSKKKEASNEYSPQLTYKLNKIDFMGRYESVWSPWVNYDGFKWRLLMFPRGNRSKQPELSMYLKCGGPCRGGESEKDKKWNKYIHITFIVVHSPKAVGMEDIKKGRHLDSSVNTMVIKETKHNFTAEVDDWGFQESLPFKKLKLHMMSPQCKHMNVIIQVKIQKVF